jgi:hypothetical protein
MSMKRAITSLVFAAALALPVSAQQVFRSQSAEIVMLLDWLHRNRGCVLALLAITGHAPLASAHASRQ